MGSSPGLLCEHPDERLLQCLLSRWGVCMSAPTGKSHRPCWGPEEGDLWGPTLCRAASPAMLSAGEWTENTRSSPETSLRGGHSATGQGGSCLPGSEGTTAEPKPAPEHGEGAVDCRPCPGPSPGGNLCVSIGKEASQAGPLQGERKGKAK